MPLRSVRGTDFLSLHPEYKQMVCPFTGEELLLVPAIEPDIALIHAQYGDVRGNLLIQGLPVADILSAKASGAVLATVEELVPTERLNELCGVQIPYFYVTAVSEVQSSPQGRRGFQGRISLRFRPRRAKPRRLS